MAAVLIPFALGLIWMMMTGTQTKLLVKTKSEWFLFGWAFATSVIWGYLVREVTINTAAILPYAVGTAIGIVLAR